MALKEHAADATMSYYAMMPVILYLNIPNLQCAHIPPISLLTIDAT
jgi:hypothetical protein